MVGRWRTFQRIFGALAIGAIAILLLRNREILSGLFRLQSATTMIAAGGVYVVLHVLTATAFNQIHHALGISRPLRTTVGEYVNRLPNRYIPGGIWHAVSRYMDMHVGETADARHFSSIFVAENCIVGCSGLIVATFATFMISGNAGIIHALMFAAGAVALGIIPLLWTRWRKLKLGWAALTPALGLLILQWIGAGLAFALYAKALGGEMQFGCESPTIAAAYQVSAIVGFLVPVAPQGWGVSELAFAHFQPCQMALVVAVAMFAGFRILGLFVDAVVYAVWRGGMIVMRRGRNG